MPKTKLNNIVKRYIDIYLLKNIIQYQIYHGALKHDPVLFVCIMLTLSISIIYIIIINKPFIKAAVLQMLKQKRKIIIKLKMNTGQVMFSGGIYYY